MRIVREDDCFGKPDLEFCCSIGTQGEILFTTPAMTEFLEYRRGELDNRPFAEFLHPDDHSNASSQLAALRDQADKVVFTARYKASGGRYSKLDWTIERCGARMFTATATASAAAAAMATAMASYAS